jgi:hypothetical protein|tara:strand:- start:156 stop:1250 length:1095 start_codon:yes stop_codon:yes gene_type:complete
MSKAAELAALIGSQSALSNRNLIINGAMNVAQRATSKTGAFAGGSYETVDRFHFQAVSRDQWIFTEEQSSDAPAGFSNSYKFTTTTAETSIEAGDVMWFEQIMEGQNLQHLQNGSSGAVSLTLSFYVKSSQTGTFGVNLYKGDNTNRIINATYTIDSASTWEKKTITFPGDTSGGGIVDDNTEGLRVVWNLASGSDFDSVNSTSWADYSTTNWAGGHAQDGVVTTLNATWQITGVQLEVGEQATPFEHRSYADELRRCQRYFQRISGGSDAFTMSGKCQGTTSVDVTLAMPTNLRASPTMNSLTYRAFHDGGFNEVTSTTPTALQFNAGNSLLAMNCGGFSGLTNNEIVNWGPVSNALTIDAEL